MTSDRFDNLIRPEVREFAPYTPGRSMESVRRERGLSRIIKLASNENPLGPSPLALRAMVKAGKSLFLYPDGTSADLRIALAKHYGWPEKEIIVGSGSDELIELLGKTFLTMRDSIVVSDHAFIRYKMAADLMGAKVISTPMKGYTHDLSAMVNSIQPNTKMLFIANPNNPTGTYNSVIELRHLLAKVAALEKKQDRRILVVIDEAYFEFARAVKRDYPDSLALHREFANLVTLRTFSKIHALAGLRIGYGFAHSSVIRALDQVRPPFNLTTVSQGAAKAAIADSRQIRRGVALVKKEAARVLPALKKLGLGYIPSVGNFVLVDVSPRLGRDVFEALLDKGIIVRAMEEYGFPHHIRVTYGLPAENKAFLKALTEVLVP